MTSSHSGETPASACSMRHRNGRRGFGAAAMLSLSRADADAPAGRSPSPSIALAPRLSRAARGRTRRVNTIVGNCRHHPPPCGSAGRLRHWHSVAACRGGSAAAAWLDTLFPPGRARLRRRAGRHRGVAPAAGHPAAGRRAPAPSSCTPPGSNRSATTATCWAARRRWAAGCSARARRCWLASDWSRDALGLVSRGGRPARSRRAGAEPHRLDRIARRQPGYRPRPADPGGGAYRQPRGPHRARCAADRPAGAVPGGRRCAPPMRGCPAAGR